MYKIGSTSRKSMNASRLSGGGTAGGNVLTERVSRISDKINEIHVCKVIIDGASVILREERLES